MKILRIIARLNVGGPARHVLWLTEALNNDKHTSGLIAGRVPEGEEDMAWLADRLGVKPMYIREMSRELSPKDAVSLWKIYREIHRQRPDILHTHTAKAGTLGRLAAFAYKWFTPAVLIGHPRPVRIVHTFHGHVFHSYYGRVKTGIFLFIERMLARLATDKIVVISRRQLDEIHGDFKIGRENQFEVIPLGIDLEELDANDTQADDLLRQIGAGPEETVVSFAGRLTEIKNLPMLLRAAAELKKGAAEDMGPVRFVIAGDGHLRKTLELEAKKLGVENMVSFIGNVEDPGPVYKASDLVALTSLNEGTPLSLIEAMALGRPVISTSVGGVVDLLGEEREVFKGFSVCERGVAVRPGDVSGFVDGLVYLIKNDRLQENLAQSGKRFIHENYSKDRLVRDIVSLYDRLTA